jgi:hypothetical protein
MPRLLLFPLVAAALTAPASAFFEHFFGNSGGSRSAGRSSGGASAGLSYATFPSNIPDEIGPQWEWLVGSEWHWNNWRNVKFQAGGLFEAPTDDCQAYAEACRWAASGTKVYIQWGNSGLHVLSASAMEPVAGTKLTGVRQKDKDPCRCVGGWVVGESE